MITGYADDPVLSAVLAYWRRKRGRRPLPRRADLDPTEIPKLLPHLQLVEVRDGGQRFRYRLAGTALVAAFGQEYTGKYLDALFTGERLAAARHVYGTVCRERRPVFLRNSYGTNRDMRMLANRLYLPLSDDGHTVNVILGALTFDWGDKAAAGEEQALPDPASLPLQILAEEGAAALPA